MGTVSEFKSAFMEVCKSYWKDRLPVPKSIKLESLPLLTDKTFNGMPVRSVMSPPVPERGVDTESLFDTWLWPHRSKEGDPAKDLTAAWTEELTLFVLKGKTLGEQTFRLLYALSNAPGAHLEHDRASIMVHHDTKVYGLIDGVVFSRFCDGVKIAVDHEHLLSETHPLSSQDPTLCAIWRESARKRSTGALWALIALWMGQPKINWQKMLDSVRPSKYPNKERFDVWVRTILNERDPVTALYKQLVPRWMTHTEFGNTIVRPERRSDNPGELARQGYIGRLYAFMYNKTKKEQE